MNTGIRMNIVGLIVCLSMVAGLLSACEDASGFPPTARHTADATFEPARQTATATAYLPTRQAIWTQDAAAATVTEQVRAATVVAFNLAYIQIEGTQQAIQATAEAFRAYQTATVEASQVAATQQSHLATETAQAIAQQQTQIAMIATATQDAINASATQTSQAISVAATQSSLNATATQEMVNTFGTATAGAYQASVQATSTQSALNLLKASEEAAIEQIALQRESERQLLLWKTWTGRVFTLLSAVVFILFIIFLTWKSWPWLLSRLGVLRWGPDGKPYYVFPTTDGGMVLADLSRNTGPVIKIEAQGNSTAPIQSPDPVLARSQAAELLLAANTGKQPHEQRRRQMLRQAIQVGSAPSAALPEGNIVDGQVVILPPEDPRLRPLLDEVAPKLISEGD